MTLARVLRLLPGHEGETARALAEVIQAGGVAGIPTDTLYGLAASPFSFAGVFRIFEIKGRDAGKALPVLIGSLDHLALLGVTADPRALAFLSRYWPGPLTAILPLVRPLPAAGEGTTLAVRLPAPDWLRRVLAVTGPLTATSANRSGEPAAETAEDVEHFLGGDLNLIVDGGPSSERRPSTLVDLGSVPPRILRAGPLTVDPSHL